VASVDPSLNHADAALKACNRRSDRDGSRRHCGGLGDRLILAIIGVFGVFSYLVEERRREIGIRLALGASRRQVGGALLRAVRLPVVMGLMAGLTLSAIAGMALRSLLFGLSPADPISYGLVAIVLTVAALVATAVPVRRALRIDPAATLKAD
jgi:ABC-type antimicrobial peptide transport system permease subunit